MGRLNNLCKEMISFYRGDPARIQHFMKVRGFAKLIGEEEGLDEKTLYILERPVSTISVSVLRLKNMEKRTALFRRRKGRQRRRR